MRLLARLLASDACCWASDISANLHYVIASCLYRRSRNGPRTMNLACDCRVGKRFDRLPTRVSINRCRVGTNDVPTLPLNVGSWKGGPFPTRPSRFSRHPSARLRRNYNAVIVGWIKQRGSTIRHKKRRTMFATVDPRCLIPYIIVFARRAFSEEAISPFNRDKKLTPP